MGDLKLKVNNQRNKTEMLLLNKSENTEGSNESVSIKDQCCTRGQHGVDEDLQKKLLEVSQLEIKMKRLIKENQLRKQQPNLNEELTKQAAEISQLKLLNARLIEKIETQNQKLHSFQNASGTNSQKQTDYVSENGKIQKLDGSHVASTNNPLKRISELERIIMKL